MPGQTSRAHAAETETHANPWDLGQWSGNIAEYETAYAGSKGWIIFGIVVLFLSIVACTLTLFFIARSGNALMNQKVAYTGLGWMLVTWLAIFVVLARTVDKPALAYAAGSAILPEEHQGVLSFFRYILDTYWFIFWVPILTEGFIVQAFYFVPIWLKGLWAIAAIGYLIWLSGQMMSKRPELNWKDVVRSQLKGLVIEFLILAPASLILVGTGLDQKILNTLRYRASHNDVASAFTFVWRDTTLTDTVRVVAKMPAGEIYQVHLPASNAGKVKSWKIRVSDNGEVCWDPAKNLCSGPEGADYTPMGTSFAADSFKVFGFTSRREAALKAFFAADVNLGVPVCAPAGTEDWKPCNGSTYSNIDGLQIVAANTRRDWTPHALGSHTFTIEYTVAVPYEVLPGDSLRLARMN